jgi:small GTP-binding protein
MSSWYEYFKQNISKLFCRREYRVMMIGFDSGGKTTILYNLVMGNQKIVCIPTVGFNVEKVDLSGDKLKIWDMGTRDKGRLLWRMYLENMDAVIFVVDSYDQDRIQEVRDELHQFLYQDVKCLPLLVFANKMVNIFSLCYFSN